jgi:hypothetical protein
MFADLFIGGVLLGAIGIYALAFWLDMRERHEAERKLDAEEWLERYYASEQDATVTYTLPPADPKLMGDR